MSKSMNAKMNGKKSALCVLLAGMLWGCMGILVRTMNEGGFTSLEVTAFRSLVTAVLMLVGMAVFKRKELKVKWKDLWCFAGTGILSVAFFNVCYFTCMHYTTLSVAAILLYTAPSFVMVLSFFLFKEKIGGRKLLALGLAFVGCVLTSGGLPGLGGVFGSGAAGFGIEGGVLGVGAVGFWVEGGSLGVGAAGLEAGLAGALGRTPLSAMGLLTGLGAGFGYALYGIFGKYAILRGYSSYTITTYTFLFALIGTVPFLDLGHFGGCIVGAGSSLFLYAFLTFMTTVAAYLFYTTGLKGLENGRASIIASIEPVMASLVGFFLYKEAFSLPGILGMILILASCVLAERKERTSILAEFSGRYGGNWSRS